jgi:hypothetical protein
MPVRLRGHHFLCMLTYKGLGYTPDFVANMTALIADISAGRPVMLIEGPDDICQGLDAEGRLVCDHDCSKAETRDLDHLAVKEVSVLLGHALDAPFRLSAKKVAAMRAAFAAGSIRSGCAECPWHDTCDAIVDNGFQDTKLQPVTNHGS